MNRWLRLIAAVTAMIMIGNLQYAWTLFVQPMMTATGWKLSEIQLGFTVFLAAMTWSMPFSGWLIDRLGPRIFMSIAAVLCAAGWGLLGHAQTLTAFYTYYAVAGMGNSFVYCCSIAVALKWFPDKRGLASGLIAGGYGSGAAVFIPIFSWLMRLVGYRTTFVWTGIGVGVIILLAGQFLRHPPEGFLATVTIPVKRQLRRHGGEEFTSREMVRTPQFYALYAIMLLACVGGLMVAVQLAPIATNFRVGAIAVAVTLSLDPLVNGAGRISWGWISDHWGRERTMAIAFLLQALFLAGVAAFARRGDAWFMILMALVFITWGEIYVLFPAALADMFGSKNAAANYSLLYSSKGVGSILAGWGAAWLFESTGSWSYAFYATAALALVAAGGALALQVMPSPRNRLKAAPSSVGELGTPVSSVSE